MWEHLGENIWSIFLLLCIISILFTSTCYHRFVTPDHRPSLKNIPYIWIPLVRYLFRLTNSSNATTNVYVMNYIQGFCKLHEKEKIGCIPIFNRAVVFLFKPETVQQVMGDQNFTEKGYEYKVFAPVMKDGLFLSKGAKWRRRRKLLTHTLHFKILENFFPLLQERSNKLVKKLFSLHDEPYLDVSLVMRSYSLEIILATAMGINFDDNEEEVRECLHVVDQLITFSIKRIVQPWLLQDIVYYFHPIKRKTDKKAKILWKFVHKILQKKKKNYNADLKEGNSNGKNLHKPFLDLMLDLHMEDKTFTEEDIFEETIAFFTAGFETTGNALTYTLYMIGLYEEVQKKVYEEVVKTCGSGKDEREITQTDLKAMKYLESVIKESLRLYPSAPYYSRTAYKTFKILDCTIPKGSSLVIFPHVIHRDPDVYPEPEKFMPERFFYENSIDRHPFAYMPFSAGPRNCIGQNFAMMEMKTVLASILRRFSIKSLDERDKILGITSPGNQHSEPLRVKFYPRLSTKV